MEPVTHVLAGACLARSGFHRRVAYATLSMAVAAEFPDVDTLWGLKGPVYGFLHHRGITHTLIGLPVEAAFLLGVAALLHRWFAAKDRLKPVPTGAPVRWGALYGCLLLALLSHLLLDYTNNYGFRPFFPFDPHWYAASIVFIFDPLIFLLLLAGLLLPELFALVGHEVGDRRTRFRSPGWARGALLAVVALWCLREYEHGRALALAQAQTLRAPAEGDAEPEKGVPLPLGQTSSATQDDRRPLLLANRSLASPDPFSPFHWDVATDFGPVYGLGTADTRLNTLSPGPILNKPPADALVMAAQRSLLGRAYLDWSPMPWITVLSGRSPGLPPTAEGDTTVTFEDVRFMGASPLLHRAPRPPLTGFVVFDARGDQIEQGLDGRVQP